MKRFLGKLLVLVLLASLIFFWFIKAPIAASYLTKKIGVNVSVSTLSVWPSETTLYNFRINNPRGFQGKTALKVLDARIKYAFKNIFHNPVEIDLIELDDVFLNIELSDARGSTNNWTVIGESGTQSNTSGKEVLIHKLAIRNMTVEIRRLDRNDPPQIKQIPYMEFLEIDSQHGFPTKELIRKIFGGAGLQEYIQNLLSPQKILQKILPFSLNHDAEQTQERS